MLVGIGKLVLVLSYFSLAVLYSNKIIINKGKLLLQLYIVSNVL